MRIIYPNINDINIIIDISQNNIHIENSYMVYKKLFVDILKYIDKVKLSDIILNRSMLGLCLEWATHNFLYNIGYLKDRTKDVDLDYPQSWKYKIGYGIIGCLVWIFIK